MHISLLLLPLLFISGSSEQNPDEASPIVVLNFKWARDRQPVENAVSASVPPAKMFTDNDKAWARQRRTSDPSGIRDPNADTIDGRSAELERVVQESREPQPVDGFAYQVRIQNGSSRVTQTVFWEYQFTEKANPSAPSHRQFLCSVKIRPHLERDLRVFSLRGPSDVVNVKNAGKLRADQFNESVIINRVEYSDGTFWQRNGWSLDSFRLTTKARSKARDIPVCRSL